MRYREFGKTGKQCSVIGFGGMRFPKDDDEAVAMVRRAVELGINYFDTAPSYCEDRSEPILGRALAGITERVYVSTKSSISEDPKALDVIRRIEAQRDRLQRDRIDFYHMWCVLNLEQFDRVRAPGGPLEGARKARDKGLIEHILVSVHANGEQIEAMAGADLFEGFTLGYNVLNHTNRYRGMRAAHEAGLAVAVMNPLGGGMIAKASDRFAYLATEPGDTPTEAALRFLLYHEEIDVVLCGMGSMDDVERNAAVAEQVEGPDDDAVASLKERIVDSGETYCTMCHYCMPCPNGIPIPYYVFAVDRCRLNDLDGAKSWMSWLGNAGKLGQATPADCDGCGQCLERCTQKLPIVERIAEAGKIFR